MEHAGGRRPTSETNPTHAEAPDVPDVFGRQIPVVPIWEAYFHRIVIESKVSRPAKVHPPSCITSTNQILPYITTRIYVLRDKDDMSLEVFT